MNILITGSEGVIGRRLVRYLKTCPFDVLDSASSSVFTCDRLPADRSRHTIADITHPETLRRAFTASRPELVFHLAASVGRRASEAWASVALRTNVEGTQNVVDLCLEFGARLLYVSTSEVYGDLFLWANGATEPGVNEEMPLHYQLGIYGLSKYLGEQVVDLAVARHDLDAVIARPFMCYSEDEPLSPYRSAIARMMRAIVRGEPIEVHEGAVRSWCYVDDMVEGLARLGLSDCQGVYNVGRHDPKAIDEVAMGLYNKAAAIFPSSFEMNSKIKTIPIPPGIYPVKHASFDKIQRDIGWQAETTLEEGLRRVVEQHMPQHETVEVH